MTLDDLERRNSLYFVFFFADFDFFAGQIRRNGWGIQKVRRLTQLTTRYEGRVL